MFKNLKEKRFLKKLQPEIVEELVKLDLAEIVNGKVEYKTGSCHTQWQITKRLMKERYNIDWKSPQDKHPDWNFD